MNYQPNQLDPKNQNAREFSARLGVLAAENATAPIAMPTRLSTILEHLRKQQQKREHLQGKINAHHFIMAD